MKVRCHLLVGGGTDILFSSFQIQKYFENTPSDKKKCAFQNHKASQLCPKGFGAAGRQIPVTQSHPPWLIGSLVSAKRSITVITFISIHKPPLYYTIITGTPSPPSVSVGEIAFISSSHCCCYLPRNLNCLRPSGEAPQAES